VDAICPADPLIVHALRELGFENVHPVAALTELEFHLSALRRRDSA
jgi:hypothetical protein